MAIYKIAVIPGDDSGPEAMDSALKVLEKALKNSPVKMEFTICDAGNKRFAATGETYEYKGVKYAGISQSTLDKIKGCQALFYTAIASAKLPRDVKTPWQLLRKYFGCEVNVRPGKSYPNTGAISPHVDMVIVREQSEGMFWAPEFFIRDEIAVAVVQCTKSVTRRVARIAFEMARARNKPRKKVSIINKAQVSKIFFGTFLDVGLEVAKEYPDVQCESMHTDYLPYAMIKEPETLDVIMCTNLLGDLYSGALAAAIGSIGIGPGAVYGEDLSIFKPSHGTAPDIAGKNLINPTATILAAKMMLDWLATKYKDDSCKKVGEVLEQAIEKVLKEGKVLTRDLGGDATTTRFTQEVLSKI